MPMAAARRGVLLARKTLAGRLLTPFPAAALSSDAASVSDRLQELKEAMAEAVEAAETVGPSANALLLETDPAARGPREQYEMHYAELALIQIGQALELKRLLSEEMGATALEQAMKEQRLHVLYADVLLWRDRTKAIVATVQQHQRDNVVSCDT
ncbi:hypothetical protein COHA_004493 [Chlorella ohadii]|uniref:Uncharacterized protein n=1 Tax=Chlorella ohadii TaxID=2649997 RepID=A0AAD5DTG0_9CHLO|nr:hypothetical protein COHA_004493 [Chlorella ohadii]